MWEISKVQKNNISDEWQEYNISRSAIVIFTQWENSSILYGGKIKASWWTKKWGWSYRVRLIDLDSFYQRHRVNELVTQSIVVRNNQIKMLLTNKCYTQTLTQESLPLGTCIEYTTSTMGGYKLGVITQIITMREYNCEDTTGKIDSIWEGDISKVYNIRKYSRFVNTDREQPRYSERRIR